MAPPDDGVTDRPTASDRSLDDILARISALRTETRARVADLGAAAADIRTSPPPSPAAARPLLTRPAAPRARGTVVDPPAAAPAAASPTAASPAAPAAAPVADAAPTDPPQLATPPPPASPPPAVKKEPRARRSRRGPREVLGPRIDAVMTGLRNRSSALRHRLAAGREVVSALAHRTATAVGTAVGTGLRSLAARIRRLLTAAVGRLRTGSAALARPPRPVLFVVTAALVVGAVGALALRAVDRAGPQAATTEDVAPPRQDPEPDVTAAVAAADPDEPAAPIVPPAPPPDLIPPLERDPQPTPGGELAVAPPDEPEPPARRPPAAVRIPAIGVEAATVPVGLEADGAMEIPADVSTIGWYEPGEGVGVAPGQVGTAVLAGHVDSRTQGAGAFYYLRDLAVGDEIVVEHAEGEASTWRVTDIIQYPKDELPIDDVFVWTGPPRLALITCGGTFDWTVRSYTDNIVVHAEPIGTAGDEPATTSG